MEFEAVSRADTAAIGQGAAPWLVLLAPGHALHTGAPAALAQALEAHPEAAAFELRCLPCAQAHHYDPVTLETALVTGGAVALRRDALAAAGGLDPRLPAPAADADLSWRLRAAGGRLYAAPAAVALAGAAAPDSPEAMRAYTDDALGRLLLAYKYKGLPGILAANGRYFKALKNPAHFAGVRRRMAQNWLRHLGLLWPVLLGRLKGGPARAAKRLAPADLTRPFATPRGPDDLAAPVEDGPKISVVVRTHNRPGRLRCALQSLANQTYRGFEVVVVEDGPPTAQPMVEAEFAHLPLRYHATGQPVGRSRAGNLGMELAAGPYLNLLDDDDAFYPDHLEQMAARAQAHPQADMVLAASMDLRVTVESEDPCRYIVQRAVPIRPDRVDLFTMCQQCQLACHSVLFKKSLFQQYGGLAENLDANEDWAMWLRYIAAARRAHPAGIDIPLATTVYVQPADQKANAARLAAHHKHDQAFFSDPDMEFTVTLRQMRDYYNGVLADVRHVKALGQLEDFLEKQARREDPQ